MSTFWKGWRRREPIRDGGRGIDFLHVGKGLLRLGLISEDEIDRAFYVVFYYVFIGTIDQFTVHAQLYKSFVSTGGPPLSNIWWPTK